MKKKSLYKLLKLFEDIKFDCSNKFSKNSLFLAKILSISIEFERDNE